MKQRTIFPLLAVTALMSLAACSSDDELAQEPEGQPTTSTITVAVPGDFASTRLDGADGYTSSANSGYKNAGKATIYLTMYNKDATKVLYQESKEASSATGNKATFTISGIKGQKVKFVAYATVGDRTLADGYDMASIAVPDNALNDESLDAFSKAEDAVFGELDGLTLTRTGCKVRLIATDWAEATEAEVNVTGIEVTATGDSKLQPWSQYDATNATFGTGKTVETLTATAIPTYSEEGDESARKTMFTDYIPVNEGDEVNTPLTIKVSYSIDGTSYSREIKLSNVPVKRNRLITIAGKVFTTNSSFEVSFTDEFDKIDTWDGTTVTPVTANADGVLEVSTAGELAWVARQVNSGNTFAGKTLRLTSDINLNNQAWTPIGNVVSAPGQSFQGTFDGNGKTISNLKADDKLVDHASSGLFGGLADGAVVKNLTVKNAAVTSTHYAGAIAGWCQNATIENCTVEDASVTSTPELIASTGKYDNGDKVGGIAGYGSGTTIKNCTVSNTALKGYRDMGGILGCGTSSSSVTDCKLVMGKDTEDNTISTVTIDVDRSHNYKNYGYGYQADNNVGAYIGRNENSTSSNNSGVVTIYYPKVFGNVDVVFDGDSFDHYGSTGGNAVPVGEGSVDTQG